MRLKGSRVGLDGALPVSEHHLASEMIFRLEWSLFSLMRPFFGLEHFAVGPTWPSAGLAGPSFDLKRPLRAFCQFEEIVCFLESDRFGLQRHYFRLRELSASHDTVLCRCNMPLDRPEWASDLLKKIYVGLPGPSAGLN